MDQQRVSQECEREERRRLGNRDGLRGQNEEMSAFEATIVRDRRVTHLAERQDVSRRIDRLRFRDRDRRTQILGYHIVEIDG